MRSYTWELWGAAYLINGGCSDDGFDYFRAGLIALGRAAFEAGVRDADSLADYIDDELSGEEFLYIAPKAYQKVTGEEDLPREAVRFPELGQRWDFDDDNEMERRYPKLFAKHCGAE